MPVAEMGYTRGMGSSAAELLEQDHSGIAELFERVSRPDEDRPAVLRELVLRLAGHVTAESAVVLPELRRCDSGDDTLAEELAQDGKHIHRTLVLIERRKANSPDMPDLVNELLAVFDGHIQRCQQRLYPELERCLDDEQMEDLSERLRSADRVVVENPHPHLLSNGPLARPLMVVAKAMDWVRGPNTRAGQWGGLFTTPNDNSPAGEHPSPESSTASPWDDATNEEAP